MYERMYIIHNMRTCMLVLACTHSGILLKEVGLSELEEELNDVHQHRVEHEALAH